MTIDELLDPPEAIIEAPEVAPEVTPEAAPEPLVETEVTGFDILDRAARVRFGNGTSKLVSLDSAIRAFVQYMGALDQNSSSWGVTLPDNVVFLQRNTSSLDLVLFYPETTQTLQYNTKKYTCRVPNIVIGLRLEPREGGKWYVNDPIYAATKFTRSTLPCREPFTRSKVDNVLFCPVPFTNFHGNGSLCFGNNARVAEVFEKDLSPLSFYYYILWNSPFNDDLGLRGVASREYSSSYRQWYELLEKTAKEGQGFPYQHLRLN